MAEVLEVSSDSSDTIILSSNQDLDDSDITALVNKYILENQSVRHSVTKNELHVNDIFIGEALSPPPSKKHKEVTSNSNSSVSGSSQEDSRNEIEELRLLQEKYTKINNVFYINDKDSRRQEKELDKKQKKLQEKEQKKQEAEREKNLKQALANINKNCKPTECLKFITVVIDNELANAEYGEELIATLESADVNYTMQTQIFPQTITWTRKSQSHVVNDDGKLILSTNEEDTNHVLYIMNCQDFLNQINNKNLCTHIQSLKSVLIDKKITLAIYGLKTYKRFLKNQHQKEMKSQISEDNRDHNTNHKFINYPRVSANSIEYALTELQLLCSCSYRLIDSFEDMALLVSQFTKAVAEIPFKLQRHEKFQQTDWFVAGDNRDTVKVDKNGNGLNRLWNQMLTMFPLARLETAEAISAKYPTVSSLMSAYNNCTSISEGELLLQEIPIRRAAGPLSSTRKIGPELSKKIYNFFTSIDANILL